MNLAELHQLPNFGDLFNDARFKGALAYLREHPEPMKNKGALDATAIIRSEGTWHGWFAALEALEQLKAMPQAKTPLPSSPAYTTHPANG